MIAQKTLNDFESSQRNALFVLDKSDLKRTQAESVLWAFAGCSDGATDGEVAEILGIQRTSVIARRHELMKKFPDEFYVDGKRLSSYGVPCDVYKIKRKV